MKVEPGAILKNMENHDFDRLGPFKLHEHEVAAIIPALKMFGARWVCPECGTVNEGIRRFCSWCNFDKEKIVDTKITVPSLRGKWERKGEGIFRCPKCHNEEFNMTKYCPECGAKLEACDEEREEEH